MITNLPFQMFDYRTPTFESITRAFNPPMIIKIAITRRVL
jgi:hypothetical protein